MGMAFKSADELNAERLADRHVHLNSNGFVLGHILRRQVIQGEVRTCTLVL